MQNGLGEYLKTAMSSASAVSAFSPPESSKIFCRRLPGGWATMSMPVSPELSGSPRRISPCPPPKSDGKGDGEVGVDEVERFLEFLFGDGVELVDGELRVLDGSDQVVAFAAQESVALLAFLEFLERHHVDRAHGVDAGFHFVVIGFGGDEIFADQRADACCSAISSSGCALSSVTQVWRR